MARLHCALLFFADTGSCCKCSSPSPNTRADFKISNVKNGDVFKDTNCGLLIADAEKNGTGHLREDAEANASKGRRSDH